MRKIFFAAMALLFFTGIGFSQEAKPTQDEYLRRYGNLVSKVGVDGLGVETLLNHWTEDYPDDIQAMLARFNMYLSKSQTIKIEPKDTSKYLGASPSFTLKDSLGHDVNYFQVTTYDDEMFGKATQILDKAIEMVPDRLDLRLLKVSALVNYEGESPDMAMNDLRGLIDYNYTQHPKWSYPGIEMKDSTFSTLIQDYCYTFFRMGTPQTQKAFKELSEKMLSYEPKNTIFMTNLGTYEFVVEQDYKNALKIYNKVLKKSPNDYTTIKNCVLLARRERDRKLEKKYLQMLVKVTTDETEKASAQVRLESL